MFYIYGLRLKGSDEFRYIGCTINPDVRMVSHSSYDAKGSEKYGWMRANRGGIEMVILSEHVESDAAMVEESRQIAKHRRDGHRLFNHQAHSRAPRAMAEETKQKLSKPKPRRMTADERQAALREWFKSEE